MSCKDKVFAIFEEKDKDKGRDRWMSRWTYMLAMMGYCMGLGNLWRFPYLCYRWGGILFFVPYLLSLFLVGIPIALLEITLG